MNQFDKWIPGQPILKHIHIHYAWIKSSWIPIVAGEVFPNDTLNFNLLCAVRLPSSAELCPSIAGWNAGAATVW